LHGLICNTKDYDLDNTDSYQDLDSGRDTEAEVETAIREFPEVLSRRDDDGDGDGDYPIQDLPYTADNNRNFICNLKTISFIAVLARLEFKFNKLEAEERGGLLIEEQMKMKIKRILYSIS